jgi:hypothetical protein
VNLGACLQSRSATQKRWEENKTASKIKKDAVEAARTTSGTKTAYPNRTTTKIILDKDAHPPPLEIVGPVSTKPNTDLTCGPFLPLVL